MEQHRRTRIQCLPRIVGTGSQLPERFVVSRLPLASLVQEVVSDCLVELANSLSSMLSGSSIGVHWCAARIMNGNVEEDILRAS